MSPDAYAASLFSKVFAWLGAIPILLVVTYGLIVAVVARPRRERFVWFLIIAVLATTPAPRQLLLLLVLAVSFPLQTPSAFVNAAVAGLYAPVLFGVLAAISVAIPLYGLAHVAGSSESYRQWRGFIAVVLAPIVFSLASVLFFPAAGLALRTFGWLDPTAVMKTADGPARYIFQYVAAPYSPVGGFLPLDEQDALVGADPFDRLRLHMARALLDPQEQAVFLHEAYPRLHEALTAEQ